MIQCGGCRGRACAILLLCRPCLCYTPTLQGVLVPYYYVAGLACAILLLCRGCLTSTACAILLLSKGVFVPYYYFVGGACAILQTHSMVQVVSGTSHTCTLQGGACAILCTSVQGGSFYTERVLRTHHKSALGHRHTTQYSLFTPFSLQLILRTPEVRFHCFCFGFAAHFDPGINFLHFGVVHDL